jgi:hypothetical protein
VAEVHRFTEHERAAADDAFDATGAAFSNRVIRHAPVAERPMEPDAAYAEVGALTHDVERHLGSGGDHHSVQLARNAADVAIAPDALDFRGVGVDRKHVVPGTPQFPEHSVGRLVSLPGDAGDGEVPASKENGDRIGQLGHALAPVLTHLPLAGGLLAS